MSSDLERSRGGNPGRRGHPFCDPLALGREKRVTAGASASIRRESTRCLRPRAAPATRREARDRRLATERNQTRDRRLATESNFGCSADPLGASFRGDARRWNCCGRIGGALERASYVMTKLLWVRSGDTLQLLMHRQHVGSRVTRHAEPLWIGAPSGSELRKKPATSRWNIRWPLWRCIMCPASGTTT